MTVHVDVWLRGNNFATSEQIQCSVRLACALSTVTFPAMKWQLVTHAEYNGADIRTRTELRDLPVGLYCDLESVISMVNTH